MCLYKHPFHLLTGIYYQERWDALMKISHFLRDICSNKLYTQHMEKLETNIIQKICKLMMIFPSCFFSSIEHLPIYLSFEAKVGDPIQYRCIYQFEKLGVTHAS